LHTWQWQSDTARHSWWLDGIRQCHANLAHAITLQQSMRSDALPLVHHRHWQCAGTRHHQSQSLTRLAALLLLLAAHALVRANQFRYAKPPATTHRGISHCTPLDTLSVHTIDCWHCHEQRQTWQGVQFVPYLLGIE
jgi:hypothetical protein